MIRQTFGGIVRSGCWTSDWRACYGWWMTWLGASCPCRSYFVVASSVAPSRSTCSTASSQSAAESSRLGSSIRWGWCTSCCSRTAGRMPWWYERNGCDERSRGTAGTRGTWKTETTRRRRAEQWPSAYERSSFSPSDACHSHLGYQSSLLWGHAAITCRLSFHTSHTS